MSKKKIALVLAVLVLAGGGITYWIMKSAADRDIAAITTAQETKKLTEAELSALGDKGMGDLSTALAAGRQAEGMDAVKQVKMWQGQLGADNPAIRMKAAKELIRLETEGAAGTTELLEAVSKDDKQAAELKLLVQQHLAKKQLAGKQAGAEQLALARQLVSDPRPGFRLAALEVLSKDKSPESLAALKQVADNDKDENVQLMAEMYVEELAPEEEGTP